MTGGSGRSSPPRRFGGRGRAPRPVDLRASPRGPTVEQILQQYDAILDPLRAGGVNLGPTSVRGSHQILRPEQMHRLLADLITQVEAFLKQVQPDDQLRQLLEDTNRTARQALREQQPDRSRSPPEHRGPSSPRWPRAARAPGAARQSRASPAQAFAVQQHQQQPDLGHPVQGQGDPLAPPQIPQGGGQVAPFQPGLPQPNLLQQPLLPRAVQGHAAGFQPGPLLPNMPQPVLVPQAGQGQGQSVFPAPQGQGLAAGFQQGPLLPQVVQPAGVHQAGQGQGQVPFGAPPVPHPQFQNPVHAPPPVPAPVPAYVPPRVPNDNRKFAIARLHYTKAFANYRAGRKYDARNDVVWGRANDFYIPPTPAAVREHRARRPPYKRIPEKNPELSDAQKVEATKALNDRLALLWAGGLRYKRTLAAGGNGLAAVFELKNRRGEKLDVVAKFPLNPSKESGIRDEQIKMRAYSRAKHIVQLLDKKRWDMWMGRDPDNHPPPRSPGDPPLDNVDDEVDDLYDEETILLLEFARYGDLDGILERCAARSAPVPMAALWHILKCLVDGLVALQYPPMRTYQVRRLDIPEDDSALAEVVPDPLYRRHIETEAVHFDLDPKNVLAFEFEPPEHAAMPVLKIADLGLMEQLGDDQDWDAHDLWDMRMYGKYGWFTPEQFSRDWDIFYDPKTQAKTREERIAGHYSHRMNIYAVGLVMWACMTNCYPEYPPVGELVTLKPFGQDPRPMVTYGSYLESVTRFDWEPELKNIVMLCLCEHPEDRPTLEHLRKWVDAGVNSLTPGEEHEVLPWLQQVLKEPPVVKPPLYDPYASGIQVDPFRRPPAQATSI